MENRSNTELLMDLSVMCVGLIINRTCGVLLSAFFFLLPVLSSHSVKELVSRLSHGSSDEQNASTFIEERDDCVCCCHGDESTTSESS